MERKEVVMLEGRVEEIWQGFWKVEDSGVQKEGKGMEFLIFDGGREGEKIIWK